MSRAYAMEVTIVKHNPERQYEIIDAVDSEWSFDDWNIDNDCLSSGAEGNLYGGETEQQFADRLATAVWVANRGPCTVLVEATCLENLPYESYRFSETRPPHAIAGEPLEKAT